MADIRINALATTAASTASDDFVAVDGSANGTRKLNAYSPTFGGNLTVSGTGVSTLGASGARVLVNGATDDSSTNLQVSGNASLGTISVQAGPTTYAAYKMSFTAQAADEAFLVKFGTYKVLTGEGYDTPEVTKLYSNNTLALTLSSTQAATLAGNLTVSGTGTSDFSGNVRLANTKAIYGYTFAGATGALISSSASDNLNVGQNNANWAALNLYGGTGNVDVYSGATGFVARFNTNGNFLLGTTTDSSNGKLQLATHTTSAGGIGFGTDWSLYRKSAADFALVCSTNNPFYFYSDATNQGIFTNATAIGSGFYVTPSTNRFTIRTANIDAVYFDASQNATFAGNIKTAAPSGGTAATWRLGTVATVSPTSPNRTIEVEIGGTTYYIHAKTTND